MFETLRCRLKGHQFVDSRSQPGMVTCVRCKHREPFTAIRKPAEPPNLSTPPRG
jgi:hypothetical protein